MKPLNTSDPTVVAGYRLLGVLGGGGMGRVYLGQSRTGRKVAIKVIRAELAEDPAFRRRFAREVAAVRTVSPLYTAAVVDADTEAAAPWLATTYIEGPSLEQWVDDEGPLAPGAVLTLAAGLSEALSSIHSVGLVHRDLKPSNVLLNDEGPHIIDFGIALAVDGSHTTNSLVVGTPSYMAPERIEGNPASPASDTFSLGATLYFAATGRSLVNVNGTMYAQIMQISMGRYDLAQLPRELRPLIVRCISNRPTDRPTADELARILVGSGVSTPSPGWLRAANPAPAVRVGSSGSLLTRRRMLALGGVLGATALGGAAWRLADTWRPGGGTEPDAAAPKPGSVLWHARSGASPMRTRQGDWIIVDRGPRIITVSGSAVRAVDPRGRQLWSWPLPTGQIAIRHWGDAILANNTERLWQLDSATGRQLFSITVNTAGASAISLPGAIRRVTLSADRAFVSAGAVTAAIARSGIDLWRISTPGSAGAHGSDEDALVTHDPALPMIRVGVYGATNGGFRWSAEYRPAPESERPQGGPGSDPKPNGGPNRGSPGPEGSGGDPRGGPQPPFDDAWNLSEVRLGADHVVLRDAHEVRALRLTDGRQVWQMASPKPVVGVAVAADLVVVAADRLAAYAIPSWKRAWEVEMRGARTATTVDGHTIVAANESGITALDLAGEVRWQTEWPVAMTMGTVDRLIVAPGIVYATFRPRPERFVPLETDVVAVAL